MGVQGLCDYLSSEKIIEVESKDKIIDLGLEEDAMIQILKDIVETSWGRDSLNDKTINEWLDNFSGEVYEKAYERKLALFLAIHVVYYNESDIAYLTKLAYRKLLHEIMITEEVDIERAAASMIFLPLGKMSESGPFLSYYFRRENNLPITAFANSWEKIEKCTQTNVVLLDDVSISGSQAIWYMKRFKDKEKVIGKKFYALFLTSTSNAEEKLKEQNIVLCTPILMDDRSRCFSKESSIYKIFDESIRDAIRLQSKKMALHYGYKLLIKQYFYNGELNRLLKEEKTYKAIKDKLICDSLGYDDSQMLLAFVYNTPNNSLPILWIESDEWSPLFKRYEKLYTSQTIGGIKNDNVYV